MISLVFHLKLLHKIKNKHTGNHRNLSKNHINTSNTDRNSLPTTANEYLKYSVHKLLSCVKLNSIVCKQIQLLINE